MSYHSLSIILQIKLACALCISFVLLNHLFFLNQSFVQKKKKKKSDDHGLVDGAFRSKVS
jgi:hypothetical protein